VAVAASGSQEDNTKIATGLPWAGSGSLQKKS
jgi:hypothetical protein